MFTFRNGKVQLHSIDDNEIIYLFSDGKFVYRYEYFGSIEEEIGTWTLRDNILTIWITKHNNEPINRVHTLYWEEVYEYPPHPKNSWFPTFDRVYKSNGYICGNQSDVTYYYENLRF